MQGADAGELPVLLIEVRVRVQVEFNRDIIDSGTSNRFQ